MEKTGKKISELRVVDLRQILEKRGLEKSGNKSVLIERLSKNLTDDGYDPATYVHAFEDHDSANDSQLSEASFTEEEMKVNEGETNSESKSSAERVTDVKEQDFTKESDASITEETEEASKITETSDAQDNIKTDEVQIKLSDDQEAADNKEMMVTEAADTTTVVEAQDAEGQEKNTEQPSTLTETIKEQVVAAGGTVYENTVATADSQSDAAKTTVTGDSTVEKKEELKISAGAVKIDSKQSNECLAGDVGNEGSAEETGDESAATANEANEETEDQFVVHVDESDTNLDYDLGDKPEERDAPTPTKDESMDVDAADIVQTGDRAAGDKEKTSGSGSASDQASKSSSDTRTDTPKKDNKDLAASQNLWISGLSSLTRATDLKAVFSKHGKVIGAKVVTNANRPGAKCYGYVTMSSSEEAAKCIQNLHRTELHGRMISVEKAKSDPAAQARAAASTKKPSSTTDTDKKKEESSSTATKDSSANSALSKDDARSKIESHRAAAGEDKSRHSDRHRPRTTGSGSAKKDGETSKDGDKKSEDRDKKPTDRKMTAAEEALDREKRRLRLQERRARDDDFRRRQALLKEKRVLAEQQRRFRAEEQRMDREREKLRIDREKVKIEEMKLESLERERARLENQLMDLRQRVDREREELKRAETLRLEEMRRSAAPVKRTYESATRGSSGRYDDGWESKRPATNDRYPTVTSDRTRSSATTNDRNYNDRRAAPVKEMYAGRSSGGGDRGGERRDYPGSDRNRDTLRQSSDSRGMSRGYEGASRRSGGASDRSSGTWSGGSGAPSLLANPSGSSDLFTGAAVQAADMMMSAAMSRTGGNSNGTSSRYSSGSSSGGAGYGGRRY